MAHIYTGERIKRLRLRQQWTQDMLRYEVGSQSDYDPDMYRLESGRLLPRTESLEKLLHVFGTDDGEIICPILDNQPMHIYTMRHILLQALENGDVEKAEEMYEEMAALTGFDTPVNRQFLLSQQARIWELHGRPTEEIKALVLEAIDLTYKNFDPCNLNIAILLFEEFELMHTLSRLVMAQGHMEYAIKLSSTLYNAIHNTPVGYREKRQKLVPVLLTRARIQQQIADYNAVIATCDEGLDDSIFYYSGRCTPDFIQYKAMALCALDRTSEALPLFKQAYMGYSLLHDRNKAEQVNQLADKYNLSFDFYGVDKLNLDPIPLQTYVRRTPPACKTFGDLIRVLREEAGLTKRDLCRGIISEANMSRLETNKIQGHMYYVKPMLERLGCAPSLYCNFYLNKNDYDNQYMRNEIKCLLIKRKYSEAGELLLKLKEKKDYQHGPNLQFIKASELSFFIKRNGISNPEIPILIIDIIKITCPNFIEDNIDKLPLTINEINLISYLAGYYGSNKNEEKAIRIYTKLIDNLDVRYQDEDGKIRMYTTLLGRLATCLGNLNNKKEALLVLNKAIQYSLSHKQLLRIPELLFTRTHYNYDLGVIDNCLAYYYMSYYGFCMFMPKFERHEKIAKKIIEEMTNVCID
ncbi:MAG: XRE family transcriptional regulator [Defluviitaleaceae bacterium]|nr:XRE family transcriptional regulator [Defluviitaleaceae bacterium]